MSLSTTDAPVTADRHASPSRRSGVRGAEAFATGVAALICMLAELPQRLVDAAGVRAWPLALVVVTAAVSGARTVLQAPFTVAPALRRRPRGPSVRQWARQELTVFGVSTAAAALVTLPLYALLRATPSWWLIAWVAFAVLTVGWQAAMPAIVGAQAGSLAPAPEPLAERVRALAARAGVGPVDVAVAGKAGRRGCNAYVLGVGSSRRVVLESAVAGWPPHLVDQVLAHELGHWRLGHTARRLPLTLAAQFGTLAAAAAALSSRPLLDWAGISSAGDPASYPLLLLVGAVVALPARMLLAWRDRSQERAADRFAVALLDRPDDFAAMLERAADESGVPRRLPWWKRLTASHPPVDERAAAARPDLLPTGA
ncbi:MAG: M48 family metalloprotease [Acidimicrobiia bacterium]